MISMCLSLLWDYDGVVSRVNRKRGQANGVRREKRTFDGSVEREVVCGAFCGSGVELVERTMLGGVRELHGTDLSEPALDFARANLAAAGLGKVPAHFACTVFRAYSGLRPGSTGTRVREKKRHKSAHKLSLALDASFHSSPFTFAIRPSLFLLTPSLFTTPFTPKCSIDCPKLRR